MEDRCVGSRYPRPRSASRFTSFQTSVSAITTRRYDRAFGTLHSFWPSTSFPIRSTGSRDYAPGYIWLNRVIPDWMVRKDKFYPNFGTAILLLLLARSNPETSKWRRALTSHIPQYLGKISFALYLVHGPIMHAVGYMIRTRSAGCWVRSSSRWATLHGR